MRIVGGTLGGRTLGAPRGRATRPTSDRVREAIGSVLQARGALSRAVVLDLFAGSGALGIEALSREAALALFVDFDRSAVRQIERNLADLDLTSRAKVLRLDLLAKPDRAAAAIAKTAEAPFSLVFADPPYAKTACALEALVALEDAKVLADGIWVVLEHAAQQAPELPAFLAHVSTYRYGDTGVLLARRR